MKSRSNSRSLGVQKFFTVSAFLFALSFTGLLFAAGEDDYLKALEAESQKITDTKELVDDGEAAEGEDTESDAQRNEFEVYMKAKYRGTYAFYRKLPDRTREEIFNAFVDGASMTDIRHMVIERKMNR